MTMFTGKLRALTLAFIGAAATTAAGCDPIPCQGEETVRVNMAGTCASGPSTFEIRRVGCDIFLWGVGDAGAAELGELPTSGTVDQQAHPVREGGWHVWGCAQGATTCPDQFRVCSSDRVAFQLNLTCQDGTGAPVCSAVLTE
jgi:hypothetical protein